MNRTDVFESHRSRMLGIAYRMLRSHADAEDLVQDVYMRWHQCAGQSIASPLAFLVTITRRLCLDRLRELKQRHADYVDLSLLEATVEDHAPSPEAVLESNAELSAAFSVVLERLSPAQRAAFFLHDIFDYDYPEVAQILCKSEQSCRQTIHRARACLREPRARFRITSEVRERSANKFMVAIGTAEPRAVWSLLAELGIADLRESTADSGRATVQSWLAKETMTLPDDALPRNLGHVTNALLPASYPLTPPPI